jgi:hypothetical protein
MRLLGLLWLKLLWLKLLWLKLLWLPNPSLCIKVFNKHFNERSEPVVGCVKYLHRIE